MFSVHGPREGERCADSVAHARPGPDGGRAAAAGRALGGSARADRCSCCTARPAAGSAPRRAACSSTSAAHAADHLRPPRLRRLATGRRAAGSPMSSRTWRAIADALGLERFAVVGRSGGAPHALACAALLPDRVTRAAALVDARPPGRGRARLVRRAWPPSNVRVVPRPRRRPGRGSRSRLHLALGARSGSDPVRLLDDLRRRADRRRPDGRRGRRHPLHAAAQLPARRCALRRTAGSTTRSRSAGPWGFDPADITGAGAALARREGRLLAGRPLPLARRAASRGATAVLEPAAAHFDALCARSPAILTWLLDDGARRRTVGPRDRPAGLPATGAPPPHTASGSRSR